MMKEIKSNISIVLYLSKVLEHANLIYLMAKRDISVKYSQSLLGITWIILQPITGMVIFTIFFTQVFMIDIGEMVIPYHLFCFSGYMCWLLFSNIIGGAGISLMQEENLIKKVYFPRIIIPISKVLTYLMDFAFSFLVLIIIAAFYDFQVIWRFILTVPAIIIILINSFTISIWLSALTIRFRDFNHIIPYIINFGIWLTPVFFPIQILPEHIRFIIELNPMTYALELFRNLLFGLQLPQVNITFIILQSLILVLLFFGLKYFIKIDRLLSDYL